MSSGNLTSTSEAISGGSDSRPRSDNLRAVVFCPGPMGIFEQSVALQERNSLGTMAIDYYCDVGAWPYRWIPEGRIKKYLRKRYHPLIDAKHVRRRPIPSAIAIMRRRAKTAQERNRWVFWHNAQFDRWVASNLPRFGNMAFGYESSSLFTFRRAFLFTQAIPFSVWMFLNTFSHYRSR